MNNVLLMGIRPAFQTVHISSCVFQPQDCCDDTLLDELDDDLPFPALRQILSVYGWEFSSSKVKESVVGHRGEERLFVSKESIFGVFSADGGTSEFLAVCFPQGCPDDLDVYKVDDVYQLSADQILGLFQKHQKKIEGVIRKAFAQSRPEADIYSLYSSNFSFKVLGDSLVGSFNLFSVPLSCYMQFVERMIAKGQLVRIPSDTEGEQAMIVAA